MLDLTSLADSATGFSIPRQQVRLIVILPESEGCDRYIESSSWQFDFEDFHTDGGALEVDE